MEGADFSIDLEEFRDLFIEESRRHLQTLNLGILSLEQDPEDAAALNDIFRAAHTLKGMAATMGYTGIAQVAHALEDLLDQARAGVSNATPSWITLLFTAVDRVEALVDNVAAGGAAESDVTEVLESLRGYSAARRPVGEEQVYESAEDDAPTLEGYAEAPMLAASVVDDADPQEAHPETLDEGLSGGVEGFQVSRIVRLDVQHLDRLLDIVTEMVIERSALDRVHAQGDLSALGEALGRYGRLMDQLQTAVLETRMVPVGQIFERFPRMVRDLLSAQEKQARLVIEGAQVELDRTTLAAVGDALVHLLRNAIDHGIEMPQIRAAAGKLPEGTVRLSAYYERNTVVVEVCDDGRGMDPAQIADEAVRRGVIAREALAEMSDEQILMLICSPRFSLRSDVTEVSGRGVGMDAVKRQIELMRGSLEIESHCGEGATFRLYLPSNLALLDALLVEVAGAEYAVPAAHVEHILATDPEHLVRVGGRMMLQRPEGVISLRSARQYLEGIEDDVFPTTVLVMRQHNQTLGVGVDRVIGYEQIVAKPLPPVLEANAQLSGVTVLGEGQVAFIVDLRG